MRSALRLFCLVLLLAGPCLGQESRLDVVRQRGVLLVGTPGDYAPFSVGDPALEVKGFDIDMARMMAAELGVEIRFVRTRWDSLAEGLQAGRYDLALGGITRTLARQLDAGFTRPYLSLGKCPLVRMKDAQKFRSLEDIDRPDVRVAVNPGGTNESFAREHLLQAQIVVMEDNLGIPEALVRGEVDVLITDNVEARLVARRDPRLAAVSPGAPLSRDTLGIMAPRDDQAFLNWLNLFLEEIEQGGQLAELKARWF